MNDLSLQVIGQTLLGMEDPDLMREIGRHLHTMLQLANRFVVPWGEWLMNVPLPSTLRYRNAVKGLNGVVSRLIEKGRHERTSDNLIQTLLESRHPDGGELTDTEIRDEIVTMIVAGHETVAVGLTWSLYLMACHPELQDELALRTAEVIGKRDPEADDYSNLDFLQHAFSETLRLYPPIWILGRRNLEDYTFRNFTAAKGSVFLVCMAELHRSQRFFVDADDFKPERWLSPDWPAYAYVPFGGGDRRCIGERFAWMESVIVLACLLRSWRFSLIDTKPPAASAKLTLHPKRSLRLQANPRHDAP